MPVDPNVYALSIQLAFEAQSAFDTLDDFGQKVTDLEEEVSSAAQKAIQNLGQIASEASSHLSDIGKLLTEIEAKTLKVETNLGEATKELKDQFDTGEDRLEDLEDEYDFWEKTFKLQEDLGKELQTHLDLNTEFLGLTTRIIDAVKQKNKGHLEQNGLLQNDVDLGTTFGKVVDGNVSKTKDLSKEADKVAISWRTVWGWIKKADEDTEKFTTTNYRHYGSQQQLVQGARELAMANGIAYEQAVEAYAVMGNLKVPREELDKYAKAVSLANRTTGVGIQATGDYVNRLRTAGMSLQQTERQLAFAGEAMRKYGLNTRDVNALMNTSAANAKNAARIFGQMDLSKWEESRFIMAGFAREAGHSAEEMAQFENWILNDIAALEQFKALTNTTEQGVDGYRLAMLRAGIATEKQMAALEARQAADENVQAEMLATQQALIDTQFGGNRAAYEAARAQGRLAMQNGMTGASIEEVNRLTEIYANTLNNQAAEANNTFTRQLKLLGDKVWAAAASVLQFIADALLPLLKALNWLAEQIGWVAGKIGEFIRWMESIPVLGKVVTFLKWAVGIVMALGLAFIFLSGVVISFSAVLGGFGGLMGRMTAGVQAFANMILILVRALGQAIVIILSSIGQGLAALGNSVKSVVGPLLAVGLALMMAGIGAYFFAMGVKIVAEMGWVAIPALLGMIIAIGLLGLVLVGLAMLVQGPVALGLIVLAIAIFAVGLAALMMGVGIYMAAQGFQILAEVLTIGLILKFGLLGLAIIGLGYMAIGALPGIYALAIGLLAVGLAAILIAVAFYIVAAALQMIGAEAIPALANAFMQGALYMVGAAALLAVAAALMIVAALLLAVAVAYMVPLAPSLLTIGMALLIGGVLMAVGGMLLMVAGIGILIGGLGIMIGGAALYVGLLLLGLSTPLMFGIGIALMIGATMMKAGAAALMTTGLLVLVGGLAMFIGAALLLAAGRLMVEAVPLFIQAGVGYIESAAQILTGSVMLAGAGVFMVVAGILLSTGGIALIVAGIMLAIGLAFLSDSSQEMLEIGMRIGIGGMMMLAGAQALVTAASMLGDSAGHIERGLDILEGLMPKVTEAANAMFPAGALLRVASLQLALGCIYISIAGDALRTGAFDLLIGVIILNVAVKMLGEVAPSMLTSSLWVMLSATLLLQAVGILMQAGTLMITASNTLYMGAIILTGAMRSLLPAAFTMYLAGDMLYDGSVMLRWGARILFSAAFGLMVAAIVLQPASQMLLAAAEMLLPAAEMALAAGMILLAGSVVIMLATIVLTIATLALARASMLIVFTAPLFLGAMSIMLVGSMFLAVAGRNILTAAIQLAVAGMMLPTAAMNILDAMFLLAEAGDMAAYASGELIYGSMVLSFAARLMMDSASILMNAGNLMRPAAWAIYGGLLWLEFAVFRFSKTIDKVEKIGAAMSLLADSFVALHNTPLTGLKDLSSEALGAIPNIERLGTGLSVAARKLDEGVRAFQGPAERLNTILSELTETITAFGQGLNLTEDVGRLADMLENYAALLEGASERIETAVATKAVPAMRAAEEAGIEETVRSEAISTVQVVNQTDGAARDAQDETSKQLTKLNETMTVVKDLMVEMQAGGKGELSEILAVLQAYLPGLNKGDAGLGSELNSWAK